MKKSQFTYQQIAFAVQQAETGVAVEEVCRKLRVSWQMLSRWEKKFAGLGVAQVRRLKLLEEEYKKLNALVASPPPGAPGRPKRQSGQRRPVADGADRQARRAPPAPPVIVTVHFITGHARAIQNRPV